MNNRSESSTVAGVAAVYLSHLRREEVAILLGPQHGLPQTQRQRVPSAPQGGQLEPLQNLSV